MSDRFLFGCSAECDCCMHCQVTPCAGVMAGGFCDRLCFCGEERDDELDPLDRMDPDYCSDEEDMP